MKTAVRILRGRHRGREGWISGTLDDRALRGITKAIVKFETAPAELLAVSSLAEDNQIALDLPQNAKRPAAGQEPAAV